MAEMTPATREELFLNAAKNGSIEGCPTPATRTEKYLYEMATNGGGSGSGGGIDFSSTETKIGTFLGADLYSKVYATTGTGGENLQYKNSDFSNKKIFYAFAVSRYDDIYRSQFVATVKSGTALGSSNVALNFTFSTSLASTNDIDIIVIYTKIS